MKIMVINGPNLNMVGVREKGVYGTKTFSEICDYIKEEYENVANSVQSLLTDDISSYSNYKNEFIKFITNFINFHDTIKKANEIFIKNEFEPEEEWI